MSTIANATLFDRLGGQAAVDAAVEIFYRKVLADKSISHYFENTNMDTQARKQKAFMTMAFGGPNRYSGKAMREAHSHLPGLDDVHFDAVGKALHDTLVELGVAPDLTGEVMALVETTRSDVLNR